MKNIIVKLLLLVSIDVVAQIDNSFKDDRTNIYVHALDSLIRIIDIEITPTGTVYQKIYIDADRQILRSLPAYIGDHEIIKKQTLNGQLKGKRKLNGLWIAINPIAIYDKGSFNIRLSPYIQKRKRFEMYDSFIFHYEYDPKKETIKLSYVGRQGTML